MLRMHRITPIQTTVKVNAGKILKTYQIMKYSQRNVGKYSRSMKLLSIRSEIQQQRPAFATVLARVV